MTRDEPRLLLTTSPFLKHREDTAYLMWQVNYALVPVLLAAIWFFGINALLIAVACIAGALLPEWLHNRSRSGRSTLRDGSGVITGALLALTLPPTTPLWMAFTGGFVAIALGKLIFGGIGSNVFNPALVGRAFLQAAFPSMLTTWAQPVPGSELLTVRGDLFAFPFLKPGIDAITQATPLSQMKFDGVVTNATDLLFGTTAGSLGETGSLIILICGLYLGLRRVLNWRIPISILATVGLIAAATHLIDPARFAPPMFHLFSGGLMLGAIFMATDPVSSPITQRGCWIFGVGIGALVMIIRLFGGLPEGVMYAILLMNATTPLINRTTQGRVYGTSWRAKRH
ncbi:MAG: RnfABCDGE type electron transport complex subunit D [Rhodothermales bacterium]|nr:RnfABCDGE type electron transport complex subunit D [Rhodothermales bacterium]